MKLSLEQSALLNEAGSAASILLSSFKNGLSRDPIYNDTFLRKGQLTLVMSTVGGYVSLLIAAPNRLRHGWVWVLMPEPYSSTKPHKTDPP